MKIRRFAAYGSAVALGLSSVMALAIGSASAATTTIYEWTDAASATAATAPSTCTSDCWSVPGNWKTSTDGGTTWTTATTAPTNGVDLMFDNTGLTANGTSNDDIPSLSVGNVTFKNAATTYSYAVSQSGTAMLTVTGGLGAASTNSYPSLTLGMPVTFSGATVIGSSTANVTDVSATGAITVSSGSLSVYANYTSLGSSLTIPTGATLNVYGQNDSVYNMLDGGGAINIEPLTGTNSNTANTFTVSDYSYSNKFSGTFDIKSGTALQISSPTDLGTAAVTIESGGQLYLYDSPQKATSSDSITITNAITMGGNGAGVFSQSQGAIQTGLYDGNTKVTGGTLGVTLSGAVTLTSDTTLSSVYDTTSTYNFTGALNLNGHKLTAVGASQPTYGTTVIQVNGTPLAAATTTATTTAAPAAPKTPNTGLALVSAKPATVLGTTIAAALALAFIARRVSPSKR